MFYSTRNRSIAVLLTTNKTRNRITRASETHKKHKKNLQYLRQT